MLAVTEPGVETITAMSCTQLMKTALLENIFGYFAHLDPCPILLLQPKEDAAEGFSRERITPMVNATPVLKALVGTGKTRNAKESLLFKSFPGGFLALAGAGSPDNVARRPIRVLLCDEVDKYVITREGPVIPLAEERLATFGADSLAVRACSPTIDDESEIARYFDLSDQRRASVACPHCSHRQFPDFFKHVHWPKDGEKHRPEKAAIHCEACGCAWTEGERLRALQTVRWHQTKPFTCCGERHAPLDEYDRSWRAVEGAEAAPERAPVDEVWDWWVGPRHAVYRARCRGCGTWPVSNANAGFTASKLFSPWTKDSPARIARKYLDAKADQGLLQYWWNTQQGLPFRPHAGKAVNAEALAARAEQWTAEVPHGVAVLTAGVDVQGDRVEVETVGWGHNEESWSLDHEVFEGDPDTDAVWDRVDAYLKKTWRRDDGRPFRIDAACVDTGGHSTQKVYQFCKARLGRKVWGIKGESAQAGVRNPVWPPKRPTSATKKSYRPTIIGVNAAKDTIRNRLLIETPGSGYMHFQAERDLVWYAQLTAERIVIKQFSGQRRRVWEPIPGRANEALDCRVYAYAALCGLLHFGLRLNQRADAATKPYEGGADDGPATSRPAIAQQDDPLATPSGPIGLPSPGPLVTIHQAPRTGRANRYAR
jgi:phage terminase large subunit GpA-like protein